MSTYYQMQMASYATTWRLSGGIYRNHYIFSINNGTALVDCFAINLNTGEYAWKIPFGQYPELAEKGMKDTGSDNYGGPVVTASGILFIGATSWDKKFHAYDKLTGKLLWETTMVNAGNATPATYEVSGRQYVIIAAFGGKAESRRGAAPTKGGAFVAFAIGGDSGR